MKRGSSVVIIRDSLEKEYENTDCLILEKLPSNTSGYGVNFVVERFDETVATYNSNCLMSFHEYYMKWNGQANKLPPLPKEIPECKHKDKYINKAVHNPDFWYYVCPSCLKSWDL